MQERQTNGRDERNGVAGCLHQPHTGRVAFHNLNEHVSINNILPCYPYQRLGFVKFFLCIFTDQGLAQCPSVRGKCDCRNVVLVVVVVRRDVLGERERIEC